MKKHLSIAALAAIVCMLLFFGCKKAGTVKADRPLNPNTIAKDLAKQVAEKFNPLFFSKDKSPSNSSGPVENKVVSDMTLTDKTGEPAIYVFNLTKGFVFVSADLHFRPIMAYVDNGVFKKEGMPGGMQRWINKTLENVEIVRSGRYDNGKDGVIAWNRYIVNNDIAAPQKVMQTLSDSDPCTDPVSIGRPVQINTMIYSTYVVGPLLPVTWGQSCTYNELCAVNQNFNCPACGTNRPLTGCVATAMAQLMRYHQFPATYNYAGMPGNFGNNAVEQLMRDAGVSVNMMYGCGSSGAYSSAIAPALKNTFGYASANFSNYSSSSYLNVRYNIDMYHLPVILTGVNQPTGEGHAWLADGITENSYTDCTTGTSASYLYFHMNWGWHEAFMGGTDYNGWYAYDNWSISGLNENFSYAAQAITEIHP